MAAYSHTDNEAAQKQQGPASLQSLVVGLVVSKKRQTDESSIIQYLRQKKAPPSRQRFYQSVVFLLILPSHPTTLPAPLR